MKSQLLDKIFILFILFLGCNSKFQTKEKANVISKKDEFKLNRNLDDYPITDKMFYNDKEIIFDKYGSNSNWYRNDSLNETLVFELYTDYHRMYTFHFKNNKFPNYLLEAIPFNYYEKNLESINKPIINISEKTFSKFIEKSKKVNSNYFITNSGIKLGALESQIIEKYGKPNKTEKIVNTDKLTWGESTNRIELYFLDEKLISIFIYRDLI